MSGLISTGGGYQRNALSGFQRLSAQEQQREQANKNMDAQTTNQAVSMASSLGMMAAMLFLL